MPRPVKDWRARLVRELKAAKRLFVLGVGNPGRADDGAGCLCVRRLQRRLTRSPLSNRQGERPAEAEPSQLFHRRGLRKLEEVRVLDAGEVPESATGLIREFRPTHVLIIDVAAAGHKPGTVFFISRRTIPENDLTTHRLPLSHLVRYLEKSVGCRVVLVGIEPRRFAAGESMSAEVKAGVDALVSEIKKAFR